MATEYNSPNLAAGENADEQMLQTVEELAEREAQLERTIRELEQISNEFQAAQDQLKRQAADFQNYRRRTDQERVKWFEDGKAKALSDLLDVYDDLARSLEAAQQIGGEDDPSFVKLREGVELVHRKFSDEMLKLGVVPIEAVGKPFDEQEHEALLQQPAPKGTAPGTVLSEVQRGYRLGERVLRHSKVIVAA